MNHVQFKGYQTHVIYFIYANVLHLKLLQFGILKYDIERCRTMKSTFLNKNNE